MKAFEGQISSVSLLVPSFTRESEGYQNSALWFGSNRVLSLRTGETQLTLWMDNFILEARTGLCDLLKENKSEI